MNNANFEKAVNQIIKIEGGYVNNPLDKGGATKYGITETVARLNGYSGNMKNLPIETAKAIYKKDYWGKVNKDEIHFNISFLLFDFAVNSGVKVAIKHLQTALNKLFINDTDKTPLIIDGIAGNKTKAALMSIKADYNQIVKLQSILINERLRFYTGLHSTLFREFGKGWINRIIANIDFLNTV